MASNGKGTNKAGKPAARRTPPRWNEPAPKRGNPWGLLLVLAGAGGLLYTACAPRVQSTRTARVAQAPAAVGDDAPPIPHARYHARRAHKLRVVEEPAAAPPKKTSAATDDAAPKNDAAPSKEDAPADVAAAPSETDVPSDPAPPETPAPKRRATKPDAPIETPSPTPIPHPLSPTLPRAFHVPKVSAGEFARNPSADGTVALTFDGCFDDKPLPKILAALDRHGYHATFFIAGRFAQHFPNSVRRIADDGMEIGNHSWTHPRFTTLSDEQVQSQLDRTNALIHSITGQTPTLFRPPYGDRDGRILRDIHANGYQTVYWAVDSWDSVKKGITADEITQRVLSRVKPGDVVLCHIASQATADALPGILEALDARGLRVVPVSELMGGVTASGRERPG